MTRRALIPLAVAGAAAVMATGASTAPSTPSKTRLSAVVSASPRVSGLFLATLRGRTLSWRLTLRGSTGRATVRVHRGLTGVGARVGIVLATLCVSCGPKARGSLRVSERAARALAAGDADLSLQSSAEPQGRTATSIVLGVPTLEILSPRDGEQITLPAEVHYRVSHYRLGAAQLGHIEAFAAPAGMRVPLESTGSGTATLPDVKPAFLAGVRDLTFALAGPDRVLLPNPEARPTVRDLRIVGRR